MRILYTHGLIYIRIYHTYVSHIRIYILRIYHTHSSYIRISYIRISYMRIYILMDTYSLHTCPDIYVYITYTYHIYVSYTYIYPDMYVFYTHMPWYIRILILSICPSIYLSICLSVCLSVCLSIYVYRHLDRQIHSLANTYIQVFEKMHMRNGLNIQDVIYICIIHKYAIYRSGH